MANTQTSEPNFDAYPAEVRGAIKSLHETLDTTMRSLQAIRADIEAGTYTRHAAAEDFESLTTSDGIDVFTALGDLADNEALTW